MVDAPDTTRNALVSAINIRVRVELARREG
jgi:hypothetical protein